MNDIQIALTTVGLALAAGMVLTQGLKPAAVRIRRSLQSNARHRKKR